MLTRAFVHQHAVGAKLFAANVPRVMQLMSVCSVLGIELDLESFTAIF